MTFTPSFPPAVPRSASIMQPTYLPWTGYFALMDAVDVFVILDDVQFAKRSWQQRNRIKTANGVQWLTVPVSKKGKRDQLIRDTLIEQDRGFPEKHVRALEHAYKKAPYFERYAPDLFSILESHNDNLCELNLKIISFLAGKMGIDTPLLRGTDLELPGTRAEHLVNICKHLGVSTYLSPPGSMAYLDGDNIFADHGLELLYLKYTPCQYAQLHGAYEGSLSTLDLLLNEGPGSLEILRNGQANIISPNWEKTENMTLREARTRFAG